MRCLVRAVENLVVPKLMGSCGCRVCALADASILGRRKGLGWSWAGRRLGPRYGAAMERPAPLVAQNFTRVRGPDRLCVIFLEPNLEFPLLIPLPPQPLAAINKHSPPIGSWLSIKA